jgi:hypothetical protein
MSANSSGGGGNPNDYIKGESHYKGPISYFKDVRTGICFAERTPNGGSDSYSFTEVSCEKVDAYYNRPK